ncbi:MAG: hypothetical protein M1837_001638 [Sclerophora amabilis]|nr:MAG: hypothetical protein M1837_001638 [Sclerophora amabilis]
MFIAPPEVHQGILEVVGKPQLAQLDGCDVVRWTLEQTCQSIDNNQALWATQGLSHRKRQIAYQQFISKFEDFKKLEEDKEAIAEVLSKLQEPEARSLQELYGAEGHKNQQVFELGEDEEDDETLRRLRDFVNRIGTRALKNSAVQEEQEREIAHEVEVERQVQRPTKVKPQPHSVHPGVRHFVKEGRLNANSSKAIVPAFRIFERTSAAPTMETGPWSTSLMATTDFINTVKLPPDGSLEDYLRPVNWILVSVVEDVNVNPTWLIISPFEANDLLPEIRTSMNVRLHVYTPKVSKAMTSFNSMTFHTLPAAPSTWVASPSLQRKLSLFAGNLYLEEYKEYRELCHHLGLSTIGTGLGDDTDMQIASDGFVHPSSRRKLLLQTPPAAGSSASPGPSPTSRLSASSSSTALEKARDLSPFSRSPLPFVKAVIAMRRRGQNFNHTHIGHIVNSRIVNEDDFAKDS